MRMATRKLNLNEIMFRAFDSGHVGADLIIFAGADAFTANILHSILDYRHGGQKSGQGTHLRGPRTAIKSIHQYRVENGFYDRRDGAYLMGKKGAGWYADAFIAIKNEGFRFASFCRYDANLIMKIVDKLADKGFVARVYFLPSKIAYSKSNNRIVYNSPESGDNG